MFRKGKNIAYFKKLKTDNYFLLNSVTYTAFSHLLSFKIFFKIIKHGKKLLNIYVIAIFMYMLLYLYNSYWF